MRKWFLTLHLYGGLLFAPYLVIFGFSSLHFNHHFAFVTPAQNLREWEASLQVLVIKVDGPMSVAVRDSLGLAGWTIPYKTKRDPAGDLHFDVERPGKSYTVHTIAKEHKARVEERHKGFWQVVNSLHAMGHVPNAGFTASWRPYTEACVGYVLIAAVSGIYLWLSSKRDRWLGLAALIGVTAVSLGLMACMILKG